VVEAHFQIRIPYEDIQPVRIVPYRLQLVNGGLPCGSAVIE
jgi:hypothetical protein